MNTEEIQNGDIPGKPTLEIDSKIYIPPLENRGCLPYLKGI